MTAPARTAAFHALRAIAANRADLPAALAHSRQRLSDERDRALAAEIVTGTLRWQRSLDFLIEHFAKRPLRKLDSDVVTILRLSLYQLMHLDRVPAAAVVDDAVDMTRGARKGSAAGFVNAVLRATLRQRNRLPFPARPGDSAKRHSDSAKRHSDSAKRDAQLAYLGVTLSHPEWLVARWLDRHGFEAAERWTQFNNETPRLTLRANTLRTGREGVAVALAADGIGTEPTRWAPDGLVVTEGNPLRRPLEGAFFVQDEASQLVPLTLAVTAGQTVLDLCASPGGKTTAIAAQMGDTGLVIASDVRSKRMALLRETVRQSGARAIRVVQVPASGALPFSGTFDRVLVDAPCSGLGTIRRDPDIRWRRTEADLPALARDQRTLLARAAAVVSPGGRLVYATCSSEPEENEAVVDAFLAEHADFTLADLRGDDAAPLAPFIDARGMMRTVPFEHGLEAFFAAAVIRRYSAD
ncbi:MAG: 16S rRNA (cytosine(967)-C(5))-methyltransferase RsmB [Acidimicrobiia bacterium]|nr:16S rRNA (cytosine(967)-C(5))-methyltransferase RsmB [Acidimicrobiia bacterium]